MKGKRKLLVSILALCLASLLLYLGVLTGEQWTQATTWIVAAFCTGNGLEHLTKALAKPRAVEATDDG